MKNYTMGVDCGTGGVRVGLFTLDGKLVIFASEPVALSTPKSGYAEQDPQEWWAALCRASNRAIRQSGISPDDIVGISCSTTVSTPVFADAQMQPVRPSLLWCDVRAVLQAKRISQTHHPALKYNGFGNVSAEWALPKILWFQENEPELFHKTAHICECHDYLAYQMTGELASSLNAATIRWHYDSRENGWPVDFYAMLGLEDLLEKIPSRVLAMGEPVGQVTSRSAEQMGISAGIPVGSGGCDAYCATLALGVVRPGSMAMGMGSSHLQYTLVEQPFYDKGLFGAFPDAVIPGFYAVEAGQAASVRLWNGFENNTAAVYSQTQTQKEFLF